MAQTRRACESRNRRRLMQSIVTIRKIHWRDTLALRHAVLWPNKSPDFCMVEGDTEAIHYGGFDGDVLISVASIYLTENSARLRKFATATEHQRRGVGSAMLTHIIRNLKEENIAELWCDARESATGFYERFGMQREGERFYKSGVPYFRQRIRLLPS